jgi:polysaccharide pyruvyl transferase WcaK-like protein
MQDCVNRTMDGQIFQQEKEALQNCDIVVINGEGSIYGKQRKGRAMLYIAYLAKSVFQKPCILVNHTADLSDPAMRKMAATVYPLLDDVVFREPLSAETCREFCRGQKADVVGDAAFAYKPIFHAAWAEVAGRNGYFSAFPASADGFDLSKPYICLSGSSLYLREETKQYDPVPGFVHLYRRLQEACGQVVLVAPSTTDERIFMAVADEVRCPVIGCHCSVQQGVDILGNSALYIGGRWHEAIFALTGGTPIITLTGNTFKMQALAKMIGLDAPTFDALSLREETPRIVKLAETYLSQGASLRDQVSKRVAQISTTIPDNVRYLRSF